MRWPVRREGFDPKKQSWVEGAIAALETVAGGVLALVALLGVFATGSMLLERTGHHHGRLSPMEGLFISIGLGAMGVGFLWAGFSLMFGWKTTWRSQALPAATLILVVLYRLFMLVR